jgi:hypothetical protein
MKSKADAGDALMYLMQDIGIPIEMHVDGAKEENLVQGGGGGGQESLLD